MTEPFASAELGRARLTIGIPTYNRARKLSRLLDALTVQLEAAGPSVGVLVSDNCSIDDTATVVAAWVAAHPRIRVDSVRQAENIGAGRNFRFIYDEAPGEYVWLFGDDDVPAPGAIERILHAIDAWDPDVIAGGFEQPPGTLIPVLPAGSTDQLASDPTIAARAICGMTKLTGYILRTRVLPRWQPGDALDCTRSGFHHCVLALSILEERSGGRTGLLAGAIAVSDEDFVHLRAPVSDWSAFEHTLSHPFVVRYAPKLSQNAARTSYAVLVDFLWGWRIGRYHVDESVLQEYWSELSTLRWRWRDFLNIPVTLLEHAVLIVEPIHLPRLISRARRYLTRG